MVGPVLPYSCYAKNITSAILKRLQKGWARSGRIAVLSVTSKWHSQIFLSNVHLVLHRGARSLPLWYCQNGFVLNTKGSICIAYGVESFLPCAKVSARFYKEPQWSSVFIYMCQKEGRGMMTVSVSVAEPPATSGGQRVANRKFQLSGCFPYDCKSIQTIFSIMMEMCRPLSRCVNILVMQIHHITWEKLMSSLLYIKGDFRDSNILLQKTLMINSLSVNT